MSYFVVFIVAFLLDVFYTRWVQSTINKQPVHSALYSAAIGGLNLTGLLMIVDDHTHAIPYLLGLAAGSYLACERPKVDLGEHSEP